MDDVSVHQEMMISCNGPDLAQCDSVVKHGLDMYFTDHNQQQNGKWHFLTQQKNIWKKSKSKTITTLLQKKSSLPFMS